MDGYDLAPDGRALPAPVVKENAIENLDDSHGMHRMEVRSSDSTCLRFCINSTSLRFIALEDMEAEGDGALLPIFSAEKRMEDL